MDILSLSRNNWWRCSFPLVATNLAGVLVLVLHLHSELLEQFFSIQHQLQQPQDLDLPPTGEHNDLLVVELHESPQLDSVVLLVLREPVHLLGVGHSLLHIVVLLVRLVGAGVVVESPCLFLLVHGFHLGAELQLGQRLPQDLDLPRHVELVHDLKLLLLA